LIFDPTYLEFDSSGLNPATQVNSLICLIYVNTENKEKKNTK